MSELAYPKSPSIDKRKFTKTSASYKQQVFIVLLALFVFLIVYVALIIGSAFLVKLAILYPMQTVSQWSLLLKAGAVGTSVMLFIFTLKFLFKSHNAESPYNIELDEKDHPKLFEFVRTLSKETGAPFPKKIVVNHEINAAVFYNSTILSLFMPVKKNLLIGLGLVNSVNLNEFKAILAHEFGHFSQSSMRLGSYVYMANRIVYDMVFDRDKWDELLEGWSRSDIRIAIFAWILIPIVWVVRQTMILAYKAINLIHASLSREMEFNADLVAVSVTGSNPIINGLYKLNNASTAFDFTFNHLNSAIDQKIYTDDIFFHHRKSYEHLAKYDREFKTHLFSNLAIDNNQPSSIFTDENETIPAMYASHPSNYKREKNAKKEFVPSVEDDRSPWQLFGDPEELSRQVTKNLLKLNFNITDDNAFKASEEVHAFLEKEIKETTYDERYHGLYDDRFILLTKDDISAIEKTTFAASSAQQKLKLEELFGNKMISQMEAIKQRDKDLNMLAGIINKVDKRKKFTVKNISYNASSSRKVYNELVKEYDSDEPFYKDFDRRSFELHYAIAKQDETILDNYLNRYKFHLDFQEIFEGIKNNYTTFHQVLQQVMEAGEITEDQNRSFAGSLHNYADQIKKLIDSGASINIPPLSNIEVDNIEAYLRPEKMVKIGAAQLYGTSINKYIGQLDEVMGRARRLYFKSLGGILDIQEKLEGYESPTSN